MFKMNIYMSKLNILVIMTFLIHICSCAKNVTPSMVINDKSFEVQHILYGDLTDMNDLFVPPLDDELELESDTEEGTEAPKTFSYSFDYIKGSQRCRDVQEFNEITKILNNETRRYRGRHYGYKDPEDVAWWQFWKGGREQEKKDQVTDFLLTFLIHARYQVKKVFKTKNIIRVDKRYRLGYLFNRLKRLQYEQAKLVEYAHQTYRTDFGSFHSILKAYEKVVRYDVDIIDTIEFIKKIDLEAPQTIHMPGITKPKT